MPKDRNLLIIIADGAHARFVRPAENNALHTREEDLSAFAQKRSSDIGSDRPGRSFHTDSTAHHALGPRHDPQRLEKEHFARAVAERLNEELSAGGFDELVIVAPPHTLNAIKEELCTDVQARVIGTLEKDLVKTPDHELWPHLRHWVRPVHRAV